MTGILTGMQIIKARHRTFQLGMKTLLGSGLEARHVTLEKKRKVYIMFVS